MSESLNHIHQDTKSARLIAVCKRSFELAAFDPLVYVAEESGRHWDIDHQSAEQIAPTSHDVFLLPSFTWSNFFNIYNYAKDYTTLDYCFIIL